MSNTLTSAIPESIAANQSSSGESCDGRVIATSHSTTGIEPQTCSRLSLSQNTTSKPTVQTIIPPNKACVQAEKVISSRTISITHGEKMDSIRSQTIHVSKQNDVCEVREPKDLTPYTMLHGHSFDYCPITFNVNNHHHYGKNN